MLRYLKIITNKRFMHPIITGIIVFLLLSISTNFQVVPSVYSQGTEPITLSVFPAPSTVPADGAEYDIVIVQMQNSTGFPTPAPSDTIIILSSSRRAVGDVEQTLMIPKGSSFSIAKFTSTGTPGTTTITAAATGFEPGIAEIITIDPSSSPMRLIVELAPKQLLPDIGLTGTIVVQLQDANGLLARALEDIIVSISSSFPSVATVDSSIVIESGHSYGKASFYTTFTPGATTITATASGYVTASDVLNIQGPNPSKLVVYTAPAEIPERAGANTTIAVQLQDANGVPVRAPFDVEVTLTTSNTTVGTILNSVITIESGKTYAISHVTGLEMGSASISATAQTYTAGFATITVVRPGFANEGILSLNLAPPIVLPDDSPHRAIFLQLTDENGKAIRANGNIMLHLASSNTAIGSVESDVTIPSGYTYVTAVFHSTHAAGITEITATATDFITASSIMNVAGAIPATIDIGIAPSQMPSDGAPHKSLVIQLRSFAFEPANAPSDVLITLTSSNPAIGTVDETVILESGTSTATATFYSTLIPGTTTITASASGYTPVSIAAKTVEPAPSNLIISLAPPIIPAGLEANGAIIIQLQDSSGLPARARSDIPISISSSVISIGTSDTSVILQEGDTFVKADFHPSGVAGTTRITVLASGFAGSSSILTSVLYPLTVTLLSTGDTANITSTTPIQISVQSSSVPVPDAKVSWSSTSGTILNELNKTDTTGYATAEFQHSTSNAANITVIITKDGYQSISNTILVNIDLLPLNVMLPIGQLNAIASQPQEITATALGAGQPIQKVTLNWESTGGIITSAIGETTVDGIGSTVFFSNVAGNFTITVTASKVGYISTSSTMSVSVSEPFSSTETTTTEESSITILGLDLVAIIGLVVAIVVVIVVIVLVLRRRFRRGGDKELDEDDLGELLEEE